MPSIEGSCLCGAVALAVARAPTRVTQCNCSTCRRYGTLWAYYVSKAVTISGELRDYAKKRGGLRFRSCAKCACMVSWEHERGADARMAINARLLDHAAMAHVPVSVLDGDKTWRVVERYTKPATWISPKRAIGR